MKSIRKTKNIGDSILNGRYKVLEVIHSGGMSAVYKVSDSQLGSVWCLKEIDKANAGRNKIEYRSLLKEARIMRGLNHPNIPRIVTIEEEGSSIFIVMDFVEGKSLKSILESRGTLDQDQAVSIMTQVARVMLYLHEQKNPIIYRDLKPSNIMLLKNGTIRVLDFGISEEINEDNKVVTEALGTWGFAAPEQVEKGTKYDLRSDIFSYGRTFYNLMTGVAPPRNLKEPLIPIRSINSSVSVGLESFINKCMSLNPDDRFSSFSEVLVKLPNVDKGVGRYRFGLWARLIVSSLLLVGSLVAVGVGVYGKVSESKMRDKQYKEAIEVARSNNGIKYWVDAISIKPEEIDPYFKMVDSIKEDGVFSEEEEISLYTLLMDNKDTLESNYYRSKKDKELYLEVGKLYWYYLGDNTKAGYWLQSYKSRDDNVTNEMADTLFNLTEFNKRLNYAVVSSTDKGMYVEYYKNLKKSLTLGEGGEVVDLALGSAIVDCVVFYTPKLKEDGVEKDDILQSLDMVSGISKMYDTTLEISLKYLDNINTKLESAYKSVEVAYE